MEQRPLRLGDIVDDYCPRERRLTNHVIVALVDDAVRQTRCTTCDTEHVYKEARVPRRKKKDETTALYDQVLADAGGTHATPPRVAPPESAPGEAPAVFAERAAAESPQPPDATDADDQDQPAGDESNGHHDLWPAHRRLIRATLPRTENDPPPTRPIPEFTMHQRPPHRGGFRHGPAGWQGGNGSGQPRQGGGARHGRPGGEPNGNTAGGGPGRRSGGRHRGGKHRRPR